MRKEEAIQHTREFQRRLRAAGVTVRGRDPRPEWAMLIASKLDQVPLLQQHLRRHYATRDPYQVLKGWVDGAM